MSHSTYVLLALGLSLLAMVSVAVLTLVARRDRALDAGTVLMTTSGRTEYVAGTSSIAAHSGAQWAGGSNWVPN